jgi:hypothetical protein
MTWERALLSGQASSYFERDDTTEAVSKKCKWQVTHGRPKRVNQAPNHIVHAPQRFFGEAILAARRLNGQNFNVGGEFLAPLAIARGPATGGWQAEKSDARIGTWLVTGNPECR